MEKSLLGMPWNFQFVEKGARTMKCPNVFRLGVGILAGILIGIGGCSSSTVTIYWSKPGAGPDKLQQDKEECEALQRSVGLNETRIEKCLEAKGWVQVKKELAGEVIDPPQ